MAEDEKLDQGDPNLQTEGDLEGRTEVTTERVLLPREQAAARLSEISPDIKWSELHDIPSIDEAIRLADPSLRLTEDYFRTNELQHRGYLPLSDTPKAYYPPGEHPNNEFNRYFQNLATAKFIEDPFSAGKWPVTLEMGRAERGYEEVKNLRTAVLIEGVVAADSIDELDELLNSQAPELVAVLDQPHETRSTLTSAEIEATAKYNRLLDRSVGPGLLEQIRHKRGELVLTALNGPDGSFELAELTKTQFPEIIEQIHRNDNLAPGEPPRVATRDGYYPTYTGHQEITLDTLVSEYQTRMAMLAQTKIIEAATLSTLETVVAAEIPGYTAAVARSRNAGSSTRFTDNFDAASAAILSEQYGLHLDAFQNGLLESVSRKRRQLTAQRIEQVTTAQDLEDCLSEAPVLNDYVESHNNMEDNEFSEREVGDNLYGTNGTEELGLLVQERRGQFLLEAVSDPKSLQELQRLDPNLALLISLRGNAFQEFVRRSLAASNLTTAVEGPQGDTWKLHILEESLRRKYGLQAVNKLSSTLGFEPVGLTEGEMTSN